MNIYKSILKFTTKWNILNTFVFIENNYSFFIHKRMKQLHIKFSLWMQKCKTIRLCYNTIRFLLACSRIQTKALHFFKYFANLPVLTKIAIPKMHRISCLAILNSRTVPEQNASGLSLWNFAVLFKSRL